MLFKGIFQCNPWKDDYLSKHSFKKTYIDLYLTNNNFFLIYFRILVEINYYNNISGKIQSFILRSMAIFALKKASIFRIHAHNF